MDLATFERRAFAFWEGIPARFREGVSAFVVDPGTFRKEEFEEGWCYGYCEPDLAIEGIPGAPVTSRIVLFYGSFVRIAALHDGFDWEAELAETIRHELQHHLEWRAGDDHLGDEDDLQDENERRMTGLPFTPGFHRWGTSLGGGGWLGDLTLFVEVTVKARDWPALAADGLVRRWGDLELHVPPVPAELLDDDLLYAPADVVGVEDEVWPWEEVVVVLARKRSWWPW